MNIPLFQSGYRKYSLAMIFTLAGSLALFVGHMSGEAYVALATLVLAAYGAGNVAEHYVRRGDSNVADDS